MTNRIKVSFGEGRLICRLLASWCAFAAVTAFSEGTFTDISFAQNTQVSGAVFLTVLFFVLFSIIGMILPNIHTDSWLLIVAASACALKWLSEYGQPIASSGLTYEKDSGSFLFLAVVMFALCLIIVYCIERNSNILSKINLTGKTAAIISGVCGLLGGAVVAVITCLRYKTFSSPGFDFGLFCQMFHYMKTTGLPLVTCERDVLLSHFVVHLSPISYLLLPFYAVFPSPLTLQIGQAVILFSGVIPIYLLCQKYKLSNKITVLICLIFSMYPALSAGCLYDFHENCFLVPLLLWMFYFFEKEKWAGVYIFAAGVLAVKEEAAVYVVMFALYAVISRKKYGNGVILACAGIIWFCIATMILNNSAGYWSEYYKTIGETPNPSISGVMTNRFDNLIFDKNTGLFGAVKTAIVNPGYLLTQLFNTRSGGIGKIVYFIQMLFPLGLLPFFTKKPSSRLLMTPLLVNLLTMYSYQYNIGFQYSFAATAFLFYAAIQNIPDLSVDFRRNLLAIGATVCVCMYMICIVPELTEYTEKWEEGKEKYTHIAQILDSLPDDASLNVSSFFVAYVSNHDVVYEIDYHDNDPDVDFVVYDYENLNNESKKAYMDAGYTVWKDIRGELLILAKGK